MDIRFYHINPDYIDFLKKCEIEHRGFTCVPNVSYANTNKFFYGTVLSVNGGINYYVPISHKIANDQNSILIKTDDKKNSIKGSLRFGYMIPVPRKMLLPFDINSLSDYNTKRKVMKELAFCRKKRDDIFKKARKVYESIINTKSNKLIYNSCDFKLLERAYIKYCIKNNLNEELNQPTFPSYTHNPKFMRVCRLFVALSGTLIRPQEDNSYEPNPLVVEAVQNIISNHRCEVYICDVADHPETVDRFNEWIDKHIPCIDRSHRIITYSQIADNVIKESITDADVLWCDNNEMLDKWHELGGYPVKCNNGERIISWGGWNIYVAEDALFGAKDELMSVIEAVSAHSEYDVQEDYLNENVIENNTQDLMQIEPQPFTMTPM